MRRFLGQAAHHAGDLAVIGKNAPTLDPGRLSPVIERIDHSGGFFPGVAPYLWPIDRVELHGDRQRPDLSQVAERLITKGGSGGDQVGVRERLVLVYDVIKELDSITMQCKRTAGGKPNFRLAHPSA